MNDDDRKYFEGEFESDDDEKLINNIIPCEFEGCAWFGHPSDLNKHKDDECEFAVDYLRQKCRNLENTIHSLQQQQQQKKQHKQPKSVRSRAVHPGKIIYYHTMPVVYEKIWHHPGKLLKAKSNLVHPGFHLFDSLKRFKWSHQWIEKHVGTKMNAGYYNGIALIQWTCCDNKWDENTANGCVKICKLCGIEWCKDSNEEHGCVQTAETVKCVRWSCCNQKEEISCFNTSGCTAVYSCCDRIESDRGCKYEVNMNQRVYACCGQRVEVAKGCQSKWSCCNQSVYVNGYPSVGCVKR